MSANTNNQKAKKKAEKRAKKAVETALGQKPPKGTVQSSTGRPKKQVVRKPKDAYGSVRQYGTPYNGLNSQLLKFSPSEEQAARMAWMHSVSNPRTLVPHAIPVSATPGASAVVPRVYQVPLTFVGAANALGFFAAALCTGSWVPQGPAGGQIPVPMGADFCTPGQYKAAAYCTGSSWAGSGSGFGPLSLPQSNIDFTTYGAGWGVEALVPIDFAPQATLQTRYTLVSAEIRARPLGAAQLEAGRIAAFNWRQTVDSINGADTVQDVYAWSMAQTQEKLNRVELACANWPSNKWISTVIVPNTTVCFGQWIPSAVDVRHPFPPLAWIVGSGLPPGTPIEVQVYWNVAVYGAQSYLTGVVDKSDTLVDAGAIGGDVVNASKMVTPVVVAHADVGSPGKPNAAGLASVVRAEQAGNRMPSAKQVIDGVKTAKDVIESVTGVDMAAEIGEAIAGIAAFLL